MRWVIRILAFAILVAALTLLIAFAKAVWWWIEVHTGTHYALCGTSACVEQPYYNFWSGFGSDIGEATLIAAILGPVIVATRHHNCETRGCWRVTTHVIEDPTTHVKHRQCHKHHPDIPNEHSHHGLFRHHMSDEYLADLHARVRADRGE
jgi:hypothetical protein